MTQESYNPKMKALLEQVRAEALARGFQCDEPNDMTDECYRWSVLVIPAGSTYEDENGVDVTITLTESEVYDGEENGCNFMLDVVSYGGQIIGGLCPYNYTPDVWVPRDDAEAVEKRWGVFVNGFDADAVLDSIEEHYNR